MAGSSLTSVIERLQSKDKVRRPGAAYAVGLVPLLRMFRC